MAKFLNISQETVINWLNALVDGTHERGTGYLFTGEIAGIPYGKHRTDHMDHDDPTENSAAKYCCLGVLCKTALDHNRYMSQINKRNNTTHPINLMAMLTDAFMIGLARANDVGREFVSTAEAIMLSWNEEHPGKQITHVINAENGKTRFVAHVD